MKIRLNDDAPWSEVTLVDGTIIYRRKWTGVDSSIDYKAFKKYIEIEDETTSIDNYASLTKAKLLEIASSKKLNLSATLTKAQIIEELNGIK